MSEFEFFMLAILFLLGWIGFALNMILASYRRIRVEVEAQT